MTPSRSLGRLHYHPPRAYFPLFGLLFAAVSAVWRRAPGKPRPPRSDRVVLWALGYLAHPLIYLGWMPLYWFTALVAITVGTIVCLVGAPILLPIVLASRLSFAEDAPQDESGWFHGDASDDAGAGFLSALVVIFMPVSLPFVLRIEGAMDDD